MVEPTTILAGASALSDIYGGYRAGEERKKAAKEAARAYGSIKTPDIEDMQYDPAMESYVGDIVAPDIYIPEALKSEMAGITTDPRFADAQFSALSSLDEVIEGGGMTDMDRLNSARGMQAAAEASSRAQADIQQDMARRGMGGSGQELLMALGAGQANVNRAAEAQQMQQAAAQERALQAMLARGQMGQSMQAQQFGQKADIARDKDAINKYNTNLGVNQRNLGANMGMDAAKTNQALKQGVAGRNTGAQNTASKYNTEAYQQDFENKMEKAEALTGAKTDRAKAQGDIFKGAGRAGSKALESIAKSYDKKPKSPTYNFNPDLA